jgi:hypothetical protein
MPVYITEARLKHSIPLKSYRELIIVIYPQRPSVSFNFGTNKNKASFRALDKNK